MKGNNISDSEWEVMKILWNKPYLTLKEISNSLEYTHWGYSTIRTLVTRLKNKGVISADKSGGKFKYYAVVLEEECKKQKANNFIKRIFDGSISMLVSTLVNENNLNEEEYKELMNMIDKIDGSDK